MLKKPCRKMILANIAVLFFRTNFKHLIFNHSLIISQSLSQQFKKEIRKDLNQKSLILSHPPIRSRAHAINPTQCRSPLLKWMEGISNCRCPERKEVLIDNAVTLFLKSRTCQK